MNSSDISSYPCITSCAPPDNLIAGTKVDMDKRTLTATFQCKHDNFDLVAANIPKSRQLKATCVDTEGIMPHWKFDDYELQVNKDYNYYYLLAKVIGFNWYILC